jgi:hypothetical protein
MILNEKSRGTSERHGFIFVDRELEISDFCVK